jgi:hypothetical protein
MDDRTWAEDNPQGMMVTKACWEEWSVKVGMKENQAKAQLMAYTGKQQEKLEEVPREEGCAERVVEALEGLGVVAVLAKGRKTAKKEEARLRDAMDSMAGIQILPNGREEKRRFLKSFAASKLAYGWVGQSPLAGEKKKYDSAVWKTLGMSGWCNRNLKEVLMGADMTAEGVLAQRAIGLMMRRLQRSEKSKEELKWNNKHGVHVGRVRKIMRELGWEEKWRFKLEHTAMNAELDQKKEASMSKGKDRVMHWVREAYRRKQWNKWFKK